MTYKGMITWREFKETVEAEGIKDDTPIHWIDMNGYDGVLSVTIDAEGSTIS